MNKGFSLVEMALVLLVGTIVLSGLMPLLQTMMTTRQNQIQTEAVESAKTTAILSAINAKTVATQCVPGTCSGLVTTVDCALTIATAPCSVVVYTYPIPATITAAKDFWGNDMTYTRNTNTVTYTTPPATTVFTLVSKGSDTIAGNSDDLTYAVTAAEFFSRVSRMGL